MGESKTTLRHRNKRKYKNLKNKKFRLKISDTGYAPNMDYLEYYRLQKYEGSNEIYSKHFSTQSLIAYEKSDGNIFVILDEEENGQTLFCDYLHKNELNIFIDSIKDKNKDYWGGYNETYDEDIIYDEDIDISFELIEIVGKDKILINFYNGIWFSNFIINNDDVIDDDNDDFIYYDYRDELVDAINNKLGYRAENPDIKKGIQKTIFDW